MDEETMWTMNDIAKAIRNDQPFGLRLVLSENEGKWTWALFRLENNSSFDDSLPMSHLGVVGNLYVFVLSEFDETIRFSTRKTGKYQELRFFQSDATAVRWALDLAGKWIPEPEPEPEPIEDYDIPY